MRNYKVIALFCVGKRRTFKHGEIITENDVNNAPEKVMSGFLKQVDAEVTPEPVRAEAPGEPALPPTITDVDRITPSAEPIAPAKAAEPAPVAEVSQVADLIPKKGKA